MKSIPKSLSIHVMEMEIQPMLEYQPYPEDWSLRDGSGFGLYQPVINNVQGALGGESGIDDCFSSGGLNLNEFLTLDTSFLSTSFKAPHAPPESILDQLPTHSLDNLLTSKNPVPATYHQPRPGDLLQPSYTQFSNEDQETKSSSDGLSSQISDAAFSPVDTTATAPSPGLESLDELDFLGVVAAIDGDQLSDVDPKALDEILNPDVWLSPESEEDRDFSNLDCGHESGLSSHSPSVPKSLYFSKDHDYCVNVGENHAQEEAPLLVDLSSSNEEINAVDETKNSIEDEMKDANDDEMDYVDNICSSSKKAVKYRVNGIRRRRYQTKRLSWERYKPLLDTAAEENEEELKKLRNRHHAASYRNRKKRETNLIQNELFKLRSEHQLLKRNISLASKEITMMTKLAEQFGLRKQ